MTVSDIIRRTKSLRLRKPGSDLSNSNHSTALASDSDNGNVVGKENGELQEVEDLDYSKSRDWRPYLTRLSEEFFSNPVQHPYESPQGPNRSPPSSPIYIRSPEPLIGIALGNPEVDHEFIHEPEARQGYPSNPGGSFNVSAAERLRLANDGFGAGTTKQKDHMWAASPEMSNQYKPPPEWATSAPYPRAMEQQPVMEKSKKPSPIRNVKPLRKLSWRRNLSRKSHAHIESSPDLENSPSWPLSPLPPHIEEPHIEEPQIRDSTTKQKVTCSNLDGASLLRVEIPHIEMERYSIMFANLLQAAEQPSLLTRRQGPLAKIKLATQTRTQSLQRSKLPQPAQIMVSPASTVSSKTSTPASPPVPVRSAARNGGLKGGSFPRRSATTTRPLHLEEEHSDSAGPPHLVVMIHCAGDSQKDKNFPTKHFSRLQLPGTLASSAAQTCSSSSSSPLILPHRSFSSSPVLLPRRSSSLPTSPSPLRRNPPLSPQDAVAPISVPSPALSTSAKETSIARQISISKQPRRVFVPVTSRRAHIQERNCHAERWC